MNKSKRLSTTKRKSLDKFIEIESLSNKSGNVSKKKKSSDGQMGKRKTLSSSTQINEIECLINSRPKSANSTISRYNINAHVGRFSGSMASSKEQTLLNQTNSNLTHFDYVNQYGDYLYDTILLYLYCPMHKKIALTETEKGLFVPFGPIRTGESWNSAIIRLINQVIPSLVSENRSRSRSRTGSTLKKSTKLKQKKLFRSDLPFMFDILRIQIPIYLEYITRVSFLVFLNENTCESRKLCAKSNETFQSQSGSIALHWYKYSDLKNMNLLGLEPLLLYKKLKEKNIRLQCKEVTIIDALDLIYPTNQQNHWKQLLNKVGYLEDDLISLYTDYLQHTYPSETMTSFSFKTFLTRWKLKLANIDQAFQSFTNETGNYYLTFNQLIIGLAKIDKLMLSIIKKSNLDMTKSLDQFKDILPPMSPIAHIRLYKQCYPPLRHRQLMSNDVPKNALMKKLQHMKELCVNCQSKCYTLSVHLVKMSIEGIVYEPMVNKQQDVERMDRQKRIMSELYFKKSFICNQIIDIIRSFAIQANISINCYGITTDDYVWNPRSKHMMEKIIKICNEAKNLFQNCERIIKVTSPCYVIGDIHGNLHDLLIYDRTLWKNGHSFTLANYLFLGDYVDRGEYSVECILYLLAMKLQSPDKIFILRGNHECRSLQKEFTFYDECLQKFGPENGEEIWNTFNDVFDVMPLCATIDESIFCAHGGIPSGIEKVNEIMLIKVPLKEPELESNIALELLWNDPISNAEFDDIMKNTSSKHLLNLIREPASSNAGNNDFNDYKKIWQNIHQKHQQEQLVLQQQTQHQQEKKLEEQQQQNLESLTESEIQRKFAEQTKNGFMANTKRGTACFFSEDALKNFLNTNNMSHVIRAHEVIPAGYQYHMGGKCITIFSCSNYCGFINESAVVLVYNSKIRIIKLDTKLHH